MPRELFNGRPDVVSEDIEEAPGEESVGTARVRVASYSRNVALCPGIRQVGFGSTNESTTRPQDGKECGTSLFPRFH